MSKRVVGHHIRLHNTDDALARINITDLTTGQDLTEELDRAEMVVRPDHEYAQVFLAWKGETNTQVDTLFREDSTPPAIDLVGVVPTSYKARCANLTSFREYCARHRLTALPVGFVCHHALPNLGIELSLVLPEGQMPDDAQMTLIEQIETFVAYKIAEFQARR